MFRLDSRERALPPLLIALLLLGGCGPGYDVQLSSGAARAALEAALSAWKSGGSPGTIAGSDPPVEVVDSTWQAGTKLTSFEVLREEGGQADHRFVVRLDHPTAPHEVEVPYRVIGKGPTWVYREDDYVRVMNMDNGPRRKAARPTSR
jgi:hypothetical protein